MNTNKDFDYEKHKACEDLLERFAVWYLKRAREEKCLPVKTIQDNCLYTEPDSHANSNSLSGLTLYRNNNLQVQLFIFPPNSKVPMHVHPNMDSYEVYIGGDVFFDVDGVDQSKMHDMVRNYDDLEDRKSAHEWLLLRSVRITEESSHGGNAGEKGGAFLSVQCWKNDVKPTDPTKDWEESCN